MGFTTEKGRFTSNRFMTEFDSPIGLVKTKKDDNEMDFKSFNQGGKKMTINGINGVNTQTGHMGMNQATDSYSRNIQNQIASAQKQLQELSSNEDMTLEEKMRRRQEIQQQISDLNMQLRQHQIEQRRAAQSRSEKQQGKNSSMDDMLGGTKKAENKSAGLSQTSMTAIISADNSIKQAKVQGSVATRMKGRAGVLESEIKLDKVRGGDTQAKEEELAEVEQKAQTAAASQLSTLADAGRTMEEAAKEDSKTNNKDTDVKGKDAEENVSHADAQGENENTATLQQATHTSVDIRL